MRGVISARFKNTLLFMVDYSTASSSRQKHTQTHQALRVYGGEGVGRRTTPWHFIAEPSRLGSGTSATFEMSAALGLEGHCQPSGDL